MAKKNSKKILRYENEILKKIIEWPWATLFVVFLLILVFGIQQRAQNVGVLVQMIHDFDFNWAFFIRKPSDHFPRLVSHLFFHADKGHITSNILFFLIFAPTVEKRMGSLGFIVSFFIWGSAAALAQGFFKPFSNGLIGASGAISGAAGAFFVLYPLKAPPYFLSALLGGVDSLHSCFFLDRALFFKPTLARSLFPNS